MVKCIFCEKEFSKYGSKNHEKFCELNPNKVAHYAKGVGISPVPWNKGLNKEVNEIIRRKALNAVGKRDGRASTPEKEALRKAKISATMKANPKAGGLRINSGKGKKSWYESPIAGKVYLRSSYELAYVQYLDKQGVNWQANKKGFKYQIGDKIHTYYPDFYLIDEDTYIEIKGFERANDKYKWKGFPHTLKILYKKDLIQLGLGVK